MSVSELPYSVSDHPLDFLRKTTKSIDELRSDLNKLHEKDQYMYNYMVKQLIALQLQIHPYKFLIDSQGPLSYPFTYGLDIFQGITLVFRETIYERNQTKYNDIVAKLQDVKLHIQTIFSKTSEFLTPLQCLCDMNPDLDPIQAIAPVFSKTSKYLTPLQC